MAVEGKTIDALSQFELVAMGPPGFSNAVLFMVLAVGISVLLLMYGMRAQARIPDRVQSAAEILHDFIAGTVDDQIGRAGQRFFPFVFSLFLFVLLGNLLGLLPYAFTFTSHIVVTLTLAAIVFVVSTVVAIREHGLGTFLRHFMPAGTPIYIAPLIVPVEVISYLSRLISLSVRLFANMVAGHVLLKVFGTFVVLLGGLGALGVLGAGLALGMTVLIQALELLVAVVQAYVFAVLTCVYLAGAVHMH